MPEAVNAWIESAASASALRDRGFYESPFASVVARVEGQEGPAGRSRFLRGVLAALLERQKPKIVGLNLPDSIKGLVAREYVRIERNLSRSGDNDFDLRHHKLRCDFRIVGFGRIPVGVEHIEVGGVPRSLIWKGGFKQAMQVGRIFARAGGVKPFYVGHLAHGIKPWAFLLAYDREAQITWHRNVAACLLSNPHIHGFLASSWFYDPQLERVAPHLAFLREGSIAHGALLARVGPTEGALKMALARSPERERLWSAGRYVPTSYAVLWTRDAMIRWSGLI